MQADTFEALTLIDRLNADHSPQACSTLFFPTAALETMMRQDNLALHHLEPAIASSVPWNIGMSAKDAAAQQVVTAMAQSCITILDMKQVR